MSRVDSFGLFWHDVPKRKGGPRSARQRGPHPPIPETNWLPPSDWPNLSAATVIGFDVETYDPELLTAGPGWARNRGHLIGASLAVQDGTSWYFPMRHETQTEYNMDPEQVVKFLDHALHTNVPKVGANLIYDAGWCKQEGIRLGGRLYDVQFAEALLDSETPDVSLEGLAQQYLGIGKESNILYDWLARWIGGAANDRQRKNLYLAPPSLAGPYAESDAALPIRILEKQWPKLEARGVLELFHLECRLIPLLVAMRFRGAPVFLDYAEEVYDDLGNELVRIEAQIKDIAGQPVNANAGESIKSAFVKHGIPIPMTFDKKTDKMRVTFDAASLEEIDHPLPEAILEYRRVAKVRNTFVKSYIMDKNVDGRVYCSFHPLKGSGRGARSGRFACVAEWTPILTKRGEIPIRDVVIGDEVWTHKNRWKEVIDTQIKPVDQMYNVLLSNGKTITCTAGHKILTPKGWQSVGELNALLDQMGEQSRQHSYRVATVSWNATSTCVIAPTSRPCEFENEIIAIQLERSREVYDITVIDDHSYLSCGIFHHNSSDPNLQNIPIRTDIGKKVRAMFGKKGHLWVKWDYSQIEYRMLANHAVGPGADELRARYNSDPDLDYHEITQELIRLLTGLIVERRPIKTINFGLIYGMGKKKLIRGLGLGNQQGLLVYDNYHEAAPYAKATMEEAAREVHRNGFVTTILGRKSDFNGWTSKEFDSKNVVLPYAAACRKWGQYNIERSHTHKALNRKLQGGAADVMKKAMVEAYEAGLFADDACGMPCLTVHDELDFDYENGIDLSAPCWAEFKYMMENAMPGLRVPIRMDSSFGPSWGKAD